MHTIYSDISEYVNLIINLSLYKTDVHISKMTIHNGIFMSTLNAEYRKPATEVIHTEKISGRTEANLFFNSELKKT